MKAKPKGAKYRNLFARGEMIYYRRKVGARRLWRSCKTSDWEEAARAARLYEARTGIGRMPVLEAPTFAEMAARYLAEDTAGLAPTTLEDRTKLLRPEGMLTAHFGARRIGEIRKADLVEWWHAAVEGRSRSEKTGRNYVDALSAVFGYALDLELIEGNPVAVFRATRRRKHGTKAARMEARPEPHPIDSPAELERLIGAARAESLDMWAIVLLGLDAGLRIGESLGLRWRCVDFERRELHICESRSRGGDPTATKTGRAREVQLSRRLAQALRELYIARGRPDAGSSVLPPELKPFKAFYRRWDKVLAAAGLPVEGEGRHTPHCLRDTFCSWLLSLGLPASYVVTQSGHENETTMTRHYGRWTHRGYVEPPRLAPGEVPADLLARPTGSRVAAEAALVVAEPPRQA